MNERWKMNRIGFVNFWLYDEEDFEFEDGKLLLRGQNGSGKSITTQSFIPFVLDGDRTPSRLDPVIAGWNIIFWEKRVRRSLPAIFSWNFGKRIPESIAPLESDKKQSVGNQWISGAL